jgi:hypothetical protein
MQRQGLKIDDATALRSLSLHYSFSPSHLRQYFFRAQVLPSGSQQPAQQEQFKNKSEPGIALPQYPIMLSRAKSDPGHSKIKSTKKTNHSTLKERWVTQERKSTPDELRQSIKILTKEIEGYIKSFKPVLQSTSIFKNYEATFLTNCSQYKDSACSGCFEELASLVLKAQSLFAEVERLEQEEAKEALASAGMRMSS